MTVLRHALLGNDFHQTPVSVVFSEKCSNFSTSLWAMQHRCKLHRVHQPVLLVRSISTAVDLQSRNQAQAVLFIAAKHDSTSEISQAWLHGYTWIVNIFREFGGGALGRPSDPNPNRNPITTGGLHQPDHLQHSAHCHVSD